MIKKENLIFVEKAMSFPEVVGVVSRVADEIWYKVPNVTSFEHSCYVAIGKAIEKGSVESMEGLAVYIAKRTAGRHVNRTKYIAPESFSELESEVREDSEEMEFDMIDVLADVELEAILNETTDLLAQGDRLKEEIVGLWVLGNENDASISRSLARTFGGKAESHRKRITRFRQDCHRYREYIESISMAV